MFAKLRHILKDRIGVWGEDVYWKVRWIFWDGLWFKQRKTREFFDRIQIATKDNCSLLEEMEEEDRKTAEEFITWFEVAKKELD